MMNILPAATLATTDQESPEPSAVPTDHTGSSATAIGYTGNWNDPATGLLYLRARDYDPATGQFLRVDPLVARTLQPYAYADNSPLQCSDPSGLCIGMNGTPQDRPCTYNDFVWANLGSTVPESAAPSLAGLADGFTGGLTEGIRKAQGVDCYIDRNAWYWIEYGLGIAAGIATGGYIAGQALKGISRAAGLFGAGERLAVASNSAGRALTTLEAAMLRDALRPAKLDHVFDSKHNFDRLVDTFGSREAVMEQIVREVGDVAPTGVFEVVRTVGGQTVVIRGNFVDGVPRLGTAFTPP